MHIKAILHSLARTALIMVSIVAAGLCLVVWPLTSGRPKVSVAHNTNGKVSIADRLSQYGPTARARLAPDFERLGIAYPPSRLVFVGLKEERRLEIWGSDGGNAFRHLRDYPILGASGHLGPKLRQGDRQVPEGLYRIELLNPNSLYHLSLRVNYPNGFDKTMAKAEGRSNLGGDIMIHGSTGSVGCLAMGDQASEDLFVLAADTGLDNISVILSPVDFRIRELPRDMPKVPKWTGTLYREIRSELLKLKN